QQLKAEEQQRIFHFIPNLYVTYEPHPEPLSTKMKFHLASKDLTKPAFFARLAGWAAVQQAPGSPNWPKDMASGWGRASPTLLPKTWWATPFCHRSCIRIRAISTRAAAQRSPGQST